MTMITNEALIQLFDQQQPPCVSIYLPTERAFPERKRNPLEFRALVDQAEEMLQHHLSTNVSRPLVEKLRSIETDPLLWAQGRDGLAVLASPSNLHLFDVRAPVPQFSIVADSFHLKPLLRTVQSADRFHVLCLHRDKIRLFEGNRDGLQEIEPAGVPLTLTDAVGDEVVVHNRALKQGGSRGAERSPTPRPPHQPEGHAAKGADAKFDAERFFRVIDQAILAQISRPSGLRMILAGLPEDQARFRALSNNPQLLDAGIDRSPAGMSEQELLAESWRCFEPLYLERLQGFIDSFEAGRMRQLASDDLQEVRGAADQGRVNVLLVSSENGSQRETDSASRPITADDPLDDLSELVLRQKGTVVVVPQERMPSSTGLAATYRY